MPRNNTAKRIFNRDRRPGDLVFAGFFFAFAVFLVSQLGSETKWIKGTKVFAQPTFWPAVSLLGMALFSACHFFGSLLSSKQDGRLVEVRFWARSIEFACWFMVYVWIVPIVGYLPGTILFTNLLAVRVGYREKKVFVAATILSITIVILFKALLSVKIPGGLWYEYLPDSIRNFMLLYL
ncbi:MAG: tripartite tricarboxylate transporter TctB family protein [Acidiferrobacterales bacterium]|nr:tripartite tricarboxylate transporter TctB family protein [Acidiferrobacterales bacterium]